MTDRCDLCAMYMATDGDACARCRKQRRAGKNIISMREEYRMNLYEINSQIMAAFEAAVDMETGEIINEEAYEALNGLQMERGEKIEGILLWIKNLTADANALKREKQAFADRQAAAERKAESLKRYVADALAGEKFQTERVSVTWRKSEAAEFTGNIALLPPPCIRVKTEVSLEELKRKLKEGAIIPGARLVVRNNIQIK